MFFLLPAVASCLAYAQSTNALTEQIVELFTYEHGFVNKGGDRSHKIRFQLCKGAFLPYGGLFPLCSDMPRESCMANNGRASSKRWSLWSTHLPTGMSLIP